MGPFAILGLFYPNFGLSPTFPSMGKIFPVNGVIIRFNETEILQFCDFVDLSGKCLFGPILGSFGDFDPLKL